MAACEHKHFAILFPATGFLLFPPHVSTIPAALCERVRDKVSIHCTSRTQFTIFLLFFFCACVDFSPFHWPRALFPACIKLLSYHISLCIATHSHRPASARSSAARGPEFPSLLRFCLWHCWHFMISSGMESWRKLLSVDKVIEIEMKTDETSSSAAPRIACQFKCLTVQSGLLQLPGQFLWPVAVSRCCFVRRPLILSQNCILRFRLNGHVKKKTNAQQQCQQ